MSLIKQSESKLKELSNAQTSDHSDDQSKCHSMAFSYHKHTFLDANHFVFFVLASKEEHVDYTG